MSCIFSWLKCNCKLEFVSFFFRRDLKNQTALIHQVRNSAIKSQRFQYKLKLNSSNYFKIKWSEEHAIHFHPITLFLCLILYLPGNFRRKSWFLNEKQLKIKSPGIWKSNAEGSEQTPTKIIFEVMMKHED